MDRDWIGIALREYGYMYFKTIKKFWEVKKVFYGSMDVL